MSNQRGTVYHPPQRRPPVKCSQRERDANVIFVGICIICGCAITITLLLIGYWLFWGYVFIHY